MSSENISQVHESYRVQAAKQQAAIQVKSVQGEKSSANAIADPRAVILKLQSSYSGKSSIHADLNVQEIIKELQHTFYSATGKSIDDNTLNVHLTDSKTAMQTLQSMMQENKKLIQVRAQNPQIERYFVKMQDDVAQGRIDEARNTFLTIVKNLNTMDTKSLLVDTLT